MLGGILAFLPAEESFCAWEKKVIRAPGLGGDKGGVGEEGVFQWTAQVQVRGERWPHKWPWHRAEETQGED